MKNLILLLLLTGCASNMKHFKQVYMFKNRCEYISRKVGLAYAFQEKICQIKLNNKPTWRYLTSKETESVVSTLNFLQQINDYKNKEKKSGTKHK